MLKCTSALGSDRAITDITPMDTIIRTGTTGRIMATLTTGRTIGMAGADITTATIVIIIITGTKVT
jgi:hypothetical protein